MILCLPTRQPEPSCCTHRALVLSARLRHQPSKPCWVLYPQLLRHHLPLGMLARRVKRPMQLESPLRRPRRQRAVPAHPLSVGRGDGVMRLACLVQDLVCSGGPVQSAHAVHNHCTATSIVSCRNGCGLRVRLCVCVCVCVCADVRVVVASLAVARARSPRPGCKVPTPRS